MLKRIYLPMVVFGLVGGCGPTVLTVDDAMVGPHSTKLRCVAYVEKDRFFGLSSDKPGKTVTFLRGGQILGSAHPERLIEKAVERMLPRGALGRDQIRKLHVYRGQEHPHQGQAPTSVDLAARNRKNSVRESAHG